jgi:hemoglobin-like flavoprotein
MFTLTQKRLVQESFAKVATIADDTTALFYRRLFELDPPLQQIFCGNVAEQRKKLMQMLTTVVKGLDNLEQLGPAIRELGRRHAMYGVIDVDYEKVGAALLWTLEKTLGPAFTPETREAWAAIYGLVATAMIQAGRQPAVIAA